MNDFTCQRQTYSISTRICVSSGWVGANANSGANRISLPLTRKIIHAILDGLIEKVNFKSDPYFGFFIPESLKDIDPLILNPQSSWSSKKEYTEAAISLVEKFQNNYSKYDTGDDAIRSGGPL